MGKMGPCGCIVSLTPNCTHCACSPVQCVSFGAAVARGAGREGNAVVSSLRVFMSLNSEVGSAEAAAVLAGALRPDLPPSRDSADDDGQETQEPTGGPSLPAATLSREPRSLRFW